MKPGTHVSVLCVAVALCYVSVTLLESVWYVYEFVHLCALKWVRTIGAESSLSCDVQHLGSWQCRQGDNLAREMTHSITSALLSICTKILSSP